MLDSFSGGNPKNLLYPGAVPTSAKEEKAGASNPKQVCACEGGTSLPVLPQLSVTPILARAPLGISSLLSAPSLSRTFLFILHLQVFSIIPTFP